jgi:ketosteroid isomerase-like protein
MEETFSFAEIEVFGDWAFARGSVEYQATPKTGGDAIQQSGNIIYLLKKQTDGTWKIARVIYTIVPLK